ncbi:MAG: FAD-dependent oxidoreductase [Gemmatimonadaceae bacterium]
MPRNPIAIIGAGLAGLHASRLLRAAHVDFVLIEARDRIGGRILTVDQGGQPADDGFDLGPSWYWPRMQPAIADLVEELGVPAFAQHSDGDVIFERMSREGPRRYHGDSEEPRSFRLAGGTGSLVRALARALLPEHIQFGARVTAMTLREDGVELTIKRADGSVERLTAAQVIAAVPPRLLEATVAFTPAQDVRTARRWREAPTWMAPHAKFVACYDRPFWREAGLAGTAQSMVGPMPEIHDATTASGQAALFGFLGVSADERAALGDDALIRACLDQFERCFGPEARRPRATLLKDWATDPLTATAADRVSTGHVAPDPAPWVSGPWQARLALAGSETSLSEPGYLAGAVVAAERAVDETLRKVFERGSG